MCLDDNRFVSFASTKALVSFMLIQGEISVSESLVTHVFDKLQDTLMQLGEASLNVLSFLEYVLMELNEIDNQLMPSFHSKSCQCIEPKWTTLRDLSK